MYSVEILLLDDGFIDYCLNEHSLQKIHWDMVIADNPQHHEIFTEAKAVIQALGGGLTQGDIINQVEKIKEQLPLTSSNVKDIDNNEQYSEAFYISNNGRLKTKKINRVFLYAASVLIIFSVAGFLWKHTATTQSTVTKLQSQFYANDAGKRKEIKLPDGSLVTLNLNSSISFDENFNSSERVVQLTGEAFFKVMKNELKPFIVRSDHFSATVLGTSFYVFAKHTDKEYKVDLLEGKVQLSNARRTVLLAPGEEGLWNKQTNDFSKSAFDKGELNSWLAGKIHFENTTIKDAVALLEKWYAVHIKIKRKDINNRTISGDYNEAALDDILEVLCFSLSCSYTYKNDIVIIE